MIELTRKRKNFFKGPKKLKNPYFKIAVNKPHCWIAYCEYGKVSITSSDKLLRMTFCKHNGKNVKHITCKYDKYNNFRIYFVDYRGVKDITYQFVYQDNSSINQLFNMIGPSKNHKYDIFTLRSEFYERFLYVFYGTTIREIARKNNISLDDTVYIKLINDAKNLIGELVYPLHVIKSNLIKDLLNTGFINVGGYNYTPSIFSIHKKMRQYFRAQDPKIFTQRLFGMSPKSLVKAVILHMPLQRESVDVLFLAKIFHGIWPLDKTVDFLKRTLSEVPCSQSYFVKDDLFNVLEWRDFLKNFSPKKILNWYEMYGENEFIRYLRDTFVQLQKIKKRNVEIVFSRKKNLGQIHDDISKIYNRLRHEKQYLPTYNVLKNLCKFVIDDYSIIMPETNYDLINWGDHMNICIGSYSNTVFNGDVIFTLQKNNKPVYCVQLELDKSNKKFNVVQCKGARNSSVSKDFIKKIEKTVKSSVKSCKIKRWKHEVPKRYSH